MSYEGKVFAIWRFAVINGNNQREYKKIELFRAKQFKQKSGARNRTYYPSQVGVSQEEYWGERFRLRIEGRWFKVKGRRYCFFTIVEAAKLAVKLYM